MIAQFIAALTLLTRLPVSPLLRGRAWPESAACLWAYPLVGALVGAAGGAVFALCPMPPGVAAVLALAAMAALTGLLHEDGLADTADGFGGGATPARKLEIMRDSRIGSYGAAALILSFALRGTALAGLPPGTSLAALVAACGLGRGAILLLLATLRPVRHDGAASALGNARRGVLAVGLVLSAASAAVLPWRMAAAGMAAAALAGFTVAALARRQVGGYTGDVLGAASVVAECAVLAAISALAFAATKPGVSPGL